MQLNYMDVFNVDMELWFTGRGKCLNVPNEIIDVVVLIFVGRKELIRIVSTKVNNTTNDDGA